jgi:hypothetical protein
MKKRILKTSTRRKHNQSNDKASRVIVSMMNDNPNNSGGLVNLEDFEAIRQSFRLPPAQQQGQQQQQQPLSRIEIAAAAAAPAPRKKSKKRAAPTPLKSKDQTEDDAGSEEGQHQPMVFPVKLHRMLTDIDEKSIGKLTDGQAATSGSSTNNKGKEKEDAAIVSWQPHGRCFLVRDKDAFVKRFLPR